MANSGFDSPFPNAGNPKIDRLDSFVGLEGDARYYMGFLDRLSRIPRDQLDVDTLIDLKMLYRNIQLIIFLFLQKKMHRRDPTLVIRGIFNALDFDEENGSRNADKIVGSIPHYLQEYEGLGVAFHPVLKGSAFLLAKDLLVGLDESRASPRRIKIAKERLGEYIKFVEQSKEAKMLGIGEGTLRRILKLYGIEHVAKDLYSWALSEYNECLDKIGETAGEIDQNKGWRRLLKDYRTNSTDAQHLLSLYRTEAKRFLDLLKNVVGNRKTYPFQVKLTPVRLRDIIRVAHYDPDFRRMTGTLYITPRRDGEPEENNDLERDVKLITAHESGGHHLYDFSKPRNNPVRAGIDTNFNTEGFATFAESCLAHDIGYYETLKDELLERNHALKVATRLLVDTGIHTGRLEYEEAVDLYKDIGMNQQEAVAEVTEGIYTGYTGGLFKCCYHWGKILYKELYEYGQQKGLSPEQIYSVFLSGITGFDLLRMKINSLTKN